jgi:hypothetical protein
LDLAENQDIQILPTTEVFLEQLFVLLSQHMHDIYAIGTIGGDDEIGNGNIVGKLMAKQSGSDSRGQGWMGKEGRRPGDVF